MESANFMEHITTSEMIFFICSQSDRSIMDFTIDPDKEKKHIQPEDLVKEFLKNKDNSN